MVHIYYTLTSLWTASIALTCTYFMIEWLEWLCLGATIPPDQTFDTKTLYLKCCVWKLVWTKKCKM